jgi:hypothetical protein
LEQEVLVEHLSLLFGAVNVAMSVLYLLTVQQLAWLFRSLLIQIKDQASGGFLGGHFNARCNKHSTGAMERFA